MILRTEAIETMSNSSDSTFGGEESTETTAASTEESASETPKEEVTPMSRRLADLARKERARVEKELKFKEEQTKWQETKTKYDPIVSAIANFKENPSDVEAALKLLEVSGISYQELTDRILQGDGFSEEAAKEEPKAKTVEETVEELLAKKEADKQQKEIDAFFARFKENVKDLTKDSKFISQDPAHIDTILELCVSYFDKYQQELPVETAIAEVENHLKEEYRKEYNKYSSLFSDKEPTTKETDKKEEAAATSFTDSHDVLPSVKHTEAVVNRVINGSENMSSFRQEKINGKNDKELSKEDALQLLIKQLG